jgi:hypothetical protein
MCWKCLMHILASYKICLMICFYVSRFFSLQESSEAWFSWLPNQKLMFLNLCSDPAVVHKLNVLGNIIPENKHIESPSLLSHSFYFQKKMRLHHIQKAKCTCKFMSLTLLFKAMIWFLMSSDCSALYTITTKTFYLVVIITSHCWKIISFCLALSSYQIEK